MSRLSFLSRLFQGQNKKYSRRRSPHSEARRLQFDWLERRDLLAASVVGDFNGDEIDDMAFGVPGELVGSIVGGAVNVIYGADASGLVAVGNQFWNQNTSGIVNVAQDADEFGYSLAAGDFNGDGHDDLAIGVPGETVNGFLLAGAVNVIYGSPTGLISTGNQFWSQNTSGVLDFAEDSDRFGASVAVGDFNGDLVDDLAIGAPDEDFREDNPGPGVNSGVVTVLYGTAGVGLTSTNNQLWNQDSSGILDQSDGDDEFGFALATGDFNGDGRDDLAVSAHQETVSGRLGAGVVNAIYGSATGLTSTNNQLWSEDSIGILDESQIDDHFGSSLAAGDFDFDGFDDLAIGVPQQDIGLVQDAGAVHVIYGLASGLNSIDTQFWNQDSTGILDDAEFNLVEVSFGIGDSFGSSLTAGDFNNDGNDDLAIGVPGESLDEISRAGAVNVIYGQETIGLTSTGNQFWTQDALDILDTAEVGDEFGSALSVGDFNNDGRLDLVVGVPNESVESRSNPGTFVTNAGAANVIYGSATGLATPNNQIWHQNISGILDESEADEEFGSSLLSSTEIALLNVVLGT